MIGNASVALEFFASVLVLRGIIDVETEEEINDAKTIMDLDNILDRLAYEVSGDE